MGYMVIRVAKSRTRLSCSQLSDFTFTLNLIQLLQPHYWTSLLAQMAKRLPTVWETWVPSLRREDPLEKEMATHSSTLAWKIPWAEEPGRLQLMGSQRVGHD